MTFAATRRVALFICVLTAALALATAFDAAFAQLPLGGPRGPSAPPPDGLIGWIILKQAEFYRGLTSAVRAAKADGSAVTGLLGLSFAYGIFHAAGPGHGKAVISSYLVANEETWKRGVALSFASALLQALVAILIVGIAAGILNVTAQRMGDAVRAIEIVSYCLIILVGLRLLWVKGRGFLAALRADDHAHGHHHHGHDHKHDHHHDHGHDHDHAACDHTHGPEPKDLAGPGGWQRGLTAIVAVGLRPCSGAIIVLVFALAQGLFWAGVAATFVMGLGTAITVAAIATLAVSAKALARRLAATRPGTGMLAMRGIEVLAAIAVVALGTLLLFGYLASERMGV